MFNVRQHPALILSCALLLKSISGGATLLTTQKEKAGSSLSSYRKVTFKLSGEQYVPPPANSWHFILKAFLLAGGKEEKGQGGTETGHTHGLYTDLLTIHESNDITNRQKSTDLYLAFGLPQAGRNVTFAGSTCAAVLQPYSLQKGPFYFITYIYKQAFSI